METTSNYGSQAQGTEAAKQKVQQTASQAQDKASDLASQAKEQAKQVASQAEEQAKSTVESRKGEAARELNHVAEAFRQTGEHMREQDQQMVARYSDRVADQIDQLSSYIDERSLDQLMTDAERFARQRPELFIGGAFTLGLLAARFLKSSSPEEQRRQQQRRAYERSRRTYGDTYGSSTAYEGRRPMSQSQTYPQQQSQPMTERRTYGTGTNS